LDDVTTITQFLSFVKYLKEKFTYVIDKLSL
jgi:hypothetical protein